MPRPPEPPPEPKVFTPLPDIGQDVLFGQKRVLILRAPGLEFRFQSPLIQARLRGLKVYRV